MGRIKCSPLPQSFGEDGWGRAGARGPQRSLCVSSPGRGPGPPAGNPGPRSPDTPAAGTRSSRLFPGGLLLVTLRTVRACAPSHHRGLVRRCRPAHAERGGRAAASPAGEAARGSHLRAPSRGRVSLGISRSVLKLWLHHDPHSPAGEMKPLSLVCQVGWPLSPVGGRFRYALHLAIQRRRLWWGGGRGPGLKVGLEEKPLHLPLACKPASLERVCLGFS